MIALAMSAAWALFVWLDLCEFYRGARWSAVSPGHVARCVAVAAFPALCVHAARWWP